MDRLRDPERGCPWDQAQDFASIAPYTIEEAYEVADAIDRGDLSALRDELGDLLFQVAFHARMASEKGAFDFGDVVAGIVGKLIRRHPHVFDTAGDDTGHEPHRWEAHKAEERRRRGEYSVLAGIERNLPALARATKLGKRAGRVGFDWPDPEAVRAKVEEELLELDAARAAGDPDASAEELGDLLFAIANLGRHLGINAEEALRRANAKFETRFARVEEKVAASGRDWEGHSLQELESIWQEIKRR